MNTTTHTHLDRAHSLRLVGPHRVLAQRGTLWLTCDGDATDWVLEEGSSARIDGDTPALVTALGDRACVAVTPLSPPTPLQRLQRWWNGRLGLRRPFAEVVA